jgi:hypothetical protein
LRVVEIIHDLDDVGVVGAVEVEVVLGLELRRWPFVVVVEGEGRTIEILALQRAIDALLVGQSRGDDFPAEGRRCNREAGGGGSGIQKVASIHGQLLTLTCAVQTKQLDKPDGAARNANP